MIIFLCFYNMCCKKRKNNNTIVVEPIVSITPSNHNRNETLQELESVFNEIINQLNSHYDYKIKTSEECLSNIYCLVLYIAKKYDLIQQQEP